MHCEAYRSAAYDSTGEWAVECGAAGEYCAVCEMVLCAYCHKAVADDPDHLGKKTPVSVKTAENSRKAG
ncbi:MAG TPA: hypothetical protein VN577_22035 [Terriglobales bacterium]|nr:hypothetical protein [Terriglobales bacterium]